MIGRVHGVGAVADVPADLGEGGVRTNIQIGHTVQLSVGRVTSWLSEGQRVNI